MIFYTVMRLMPAPLGFITVIFLIISLPAVILINSKNRLGRYCWTWAAIPFVAAVWAGLRTDYREEAEVFILFIFQYPSYWVVYFLLYRFNTRKRAIEILSLSLKDNTTALSAGRDVPMDESQTWNSEPTFCPNCGQRYYESDYSMSCAVWRCSACKTLLQNSRTGSQSRSSGAGMSSNGFL